MASMSTIGIEFNEESLDAIHKFVDALADAVDTVMVKNLVSACHGFRVNAVATGRCALDGSWSNGPEMVEVSSDSFRKMLDALKALDSADHA